MDVLRLLVVDMSVPFMTLSIALIAGVVVLSIKRSINRTVERKEDHAFRLQMEKQRDTKLIEQDAKRQRD